MTYDRTQLTRDDTLRCELAIRTTEPARSLIVDVGIPPGFEVDTATLDALVQARRIDKYALTAQQLILYVGVPPTGQEQRLSYSLRPRFPVTIKTPPSRAYEYYAPSREGFVKPTLLTVVEN